MSTVDNLADTEEIHYQVSSTRDLAVGAAILVAMFLFGLSMTIAGGESGGENLALYIGLGLLGLMILLVIRNILYGVRTVTINQKELVFEYKDRKDYIPVSEISHINTMVFNKKKGKSKGAVFFKVYQETKKGLTFSLRKPGGKEAFAWFQRLKESQKNKV